MADLPPILEYELSDLARSEMGRREITEEGLRIAV
jgi:hypothetical protein